MNRCGWEELYVERYVCGEEWRPLVEGLFLYLGGLNKIEVKVAVWKRKSLLMFTLFRSDLLHYLQLRNITLPFSFHHIKLFMTTYRLGNCLSACHVSGHTEMSGKAACCGVYWRRLW